MATSLELKELAEVRLEESRSLYANGHYIGAYYLAGYTIELLLKHVICKKLSVDIFDNSPTSNKVAKAFYTHDLYSLFILSGLFERLSKDKAEDNGLSKAYDKVENWNEGRRYELTCSQQTAKEFLKAVELVRSCILNQL